LNIPKPLVHNKMGVVVAVIVWWLDLLGVRLDNIIAGVDLDGAYQNLPPPPPPDRLLLH